MIERRPLMYCDRCERPLDTRTSQVHIFRPEGEFVFCSADCSLAWMAEHPAEQ